MEPTLDRSEQLIQMLSTMFDGRRDPLPSVELIPADAIPSPDRELLAHENDMTPTLENYYRCTLGLKVLNREVCDGLLNREILLVPQNNANHPVLFGAIRIYLDEFAPEPRREIVECRRPFGTILSDHDVPRVSRPEAFFQLEPNACLRALLAYPAAGLLYGRCNIIRDPAGPTLAEIVEIIPRPDHITEGQNR